MRQRTSNQRSAPGRRTSGRRRLLLLGALGLFASAVIVGSPSTSGAAHLGIFELDGNTADVASTPAAAPWDWTRFFNGAGVKQSPLPAGFVDAGFDPGGDYEFPDRSTFTGGSKDTLDVSGWSCTDSNNLGGKFDIVNAYAAIYEVPAPAPTGYTAGDQLLFFGIERAATEGDGNMGFWFLKDGTVDCTKPPGGGKAPAFTGNHTNGDIFVVAGFSNGGTNATVTAYEWANGALDLDPIVDEDEKCGATPTPPALPSHDACGIVNTAPLATNDGKPWPSPDKNGGNLDINAFYEGFVRVEAADVEGCFSTFVANTRSSTSPTSTIHDFSRGSFPTCQPSTTMTGLATPTLAAPEIAVGGATGADQVTYTFREENDGEAALTNVYVETSNETCNDALTPASVPTLAVGATAVFSCTISVGTTDAVNTIRAVGHGTVTLGTVTKDVTVCTDPLPATPVPTSETAVCDPDEHDSARTVAIIPGTDLSVIRSPTTTKAGSTITYTLAETNDGSAPEGYESSLALDDVTVVASAGTGSTAAMATECNTNRTGPVKTGGDQDAQLEPGETFTFTCTVMAPSDDFTMNFIGHGTVLKTTAHQRDVTTSSPCANTPGTLTTLGVYCDAEEAASASVTVIAPGTQLDITADALVTYTFKEKNTSQDAPLTLPTAGVRESIITFETGQLCNDTALAYSGSSGNTDLVLDPQETWTFTCKGSVPGPTDSNINNSNSTTLTGVGHGCDSTGADVTASATSLCSGSVFPANDERDRVKVSIEYFPRGPNT